MVPYDSFPSTPQHFGYGWPGLGPGDGYYVSNRTPPVYTNARSPPQHCVASLAPFLPQGRSTYHYPSPPTPVLPPPTHSPGLPRREPGGRPYSADMGRLVSVEEGSEGGEDSRGKLKGHRRSSSYGSDPVPGTARTDVRRGSSFQDLHTRNTLEEEFYYGSRETMYDTACDFLSPDLRPIPPQPNCAQSMQIYEDHRKMAAEYMHVKTELAKLRQYKADLQDQLARGPVQQQDVQYTQLKSEKEALLAFKEKLSKQLSMIEAAQSSQAGDSAHSTGDSRDGWVVVGSTHQGPED